MNERTLRIWSSFIICIFLFAPFSVRGQGSADDGPLERALRWERTVFSSEDPSVIQSALMSKAECYFEASLYQDALRTLERIRMYLLEPETASEVLLFKARCAKETGDFGAALGFLEESGLAEGYPDLYSVLLASSWRFDESREQAMRLASSDAAVKALSNLFKHAPKPRKEGIAAVLSFLPPAGQIYVEQPGRGILSMFLNAGAVGFTAMELIGHDWVTGLLGGGLLLNETFLKGNLDKNVREVDAVNKCSVEEFARSLEKLLPVLPD